MEGSTTQRSLPFQFITEHGRRPHPKSTTVSTIRSQARKYSALEQQRRNNSSHRRRNRLQIIQKAPDIPRDGRISPWTILSAGRVDPFHSLPIEGHPYVHKLLDHAAIVIQQSAMGWQSEKGEQATTMDLLLTQFLPLCISNIMTFSALLLSSETGLRAALGEHPWSSCAIQLSMNCVRLLRNELNNPNGEVSDAMIATVVIIGQVEAVFVKDSATFENHKRGLGQMVKLRGGVDKLSGILKQMVLRTTQLGSIQDVSDEADGTAEGQELEWVANAFLQAKHGIRPIPSTERILDLN